MSNLKKDPTTGNLLRNLYGDLINVCPPSSACTATRMENCLDGTSPCQLSVTLSGLSRTDDCYHHEMFYFGGITEFKATLIEREWEPNGIHTLTYDRFYSPAAGFDGWWNADNVVESSGDGGWTDPRPEFRMWEIPSDGEQDCSTTATTRNYCDYPRNWLTARVFKDGTDLFLVIEGREWFNVNISGQDFSGRPDPWVWAFYGCLQIPSGKVVTEAGQPRFDCRTFETLGTVSNSIISPGLITTDSADSFQGLYNCWDGSAVNFGDYGFAAWYGGTATVAVVPW